MTLRAIEQFAPAKINLTLHVTGQRDDGYHLLDSLVMFADVGDRVTVAPAEHMSLQVTGPMAAGVPEDARNLCWRAAEAFGQPVAITLDKHLPAAAGIGGGSSDAAAVLRAMTTLFGAAPGLDPLRLGADVPVCMAARSARMQGIGETVTPVDVPPLEALLVNPRVEVATPAVFKALARRDNPPMSEIPASGRVGDVLTWLSDQRNDLEAPASDLRPEIEQVLRELSCLDGVRLVRMSGSGATCFAVFDSRAQSEAMAQELRRRFPNWWVKSATLG
ncbi:4-(cytidine 5'-diphospho)-2-C-methyl-D-erythritol kinase [Mameliella sediminis]|uniref:4-(cytidine 5'-diphospho)-2-C-methyl-D-erythritol kinase n=1 Tax=Mameliella sediminis TaxID=2836866 RepID=UPI001C466897|nr:4-(cytidine 5'-diphospho)-2-C-methyl-D-erythritol kinase [Mameliella sediminis]MBV7394704.1 4-(cytidine 5'-diphospho)-2-C-methyl-D-erythritol kinase [Mameliella sediminis]MBY6113406.1 4-(cytidine 5'-diphospho)-2-C-methyl-D-erythritol kinase [Antarctobacter heliothermus]MBY6143246.1 4-(cytidine 5'-diphospho)-2-C-methyl-D-erythritol kinase [Mameliella alba]MCA0953030.1 4-(cytidine 5'-diphospho)-2-C-methyl-D-erythritol kinase [Mameliella alba]